MKFYITTILLILVIGACKEPTNKAQGSWIKGTNQEKTEIIEKQFRGFDLAMKETGYRYQELYWAGKDENWEYAAYQVEKIRKAIENGLERRPKRAASAEQFINETLPEMGRAVMSRDTVVFSRAFRTLTLSCNNCHTMEKVPFFTVKEPVYRQSPIRK